MAKTMQSLLEHPEFTGGTIWHREVFGELALFDEQPRSASVMTMSATELAVINGELFMQFLDTYPDTGYPIMRTFMLAAVGALARD